MNVLVLIISCSVLFILNMIWMKRKRPQAPSMHYVIRKKIRDLPFHVISLFFFLFVAGFFEESIITIPGMRPTFVMLFTRMASFISTAFILKYRMIRPQHPSPFSIPAIMNSLATASQFEALEYVSFAEFGASKALRVLVVGLYGSKTTWEKLLWGVIAVISAKFIFWYEFSMDTWVNPGKWGIIWLWIFIFSDSLTSITQEELYKKFKVPSVQMMFYINIWLLILIVPQLFLEEKLIEETFYALSSYPEYIFQLSMLSLCSAAAQYFALCIIRQFGSLTYVVICMFKTLITIAIVKFLQYGYWEWFEIAELIVILLTVGYILRKRKPWLQQHSVPKAIEVDLMPLMSEN